MLIQRYQQTRWILKTEPLFDFAHVDEYNKIVEDYKTEKTPIYGVFSVFMGNGGFLLCEKS